MEDEIKERLELLNRLYDDASTKVIKYERFLKEVAKMGMEDVTQVRITAMELMCKADSL